MWHRKDQDKGPEKRIIVQDKQKSGSMMGGERVEGGAVNEFEEQLGVVEKQNLMPETLKLIMARI